MLFCLSSCLLFGTWPEILSHLGFPRLSGPSLWCTDIHSHVNFPSHVSLQAFSSQSSDTNPRAKLKGQFVRWTTTDPSFDPGPPTQHMLSFLLVMGWIVSSKRYVEVPQSLTFLRNKVVADIICKAEIILNRGFPGYISLPASAGYIRDMGSIPGSRRSPAGGHGNPLQYSCLENPMDRGDWWATGHQTQLKWLSTHIAHTE